MLNSFLGRCVASARSTWTPWEFTNSEILLRIFLTETGSLINNRDSFVWILDTLRIVLESGATGRLCVEADQVLVLVIRMHIRVSRILHLRLLQAHNRRRLDLDGVVVLGHHAYRALTDWGRAIQMVALAWVRPGLSHLLVAHLRLTCVNLPQRWLHQMSCCLFGLRKRIWMVRSQVTMVTSRVLDGLVSGVYLRACHMWTASCIICIGAARFLSIEELARTTRLVTPRVRCTR